MITKIVYNSDHISQLFADFSSFEKYLSAAARCSRIITLSDVSFAIEHRVQEQFTYKELFAYILTNFKKIF